ncbi:hypothetical protein BGZ76_003299 [Entomortierella beljakovae]|nr:hypothetical protein BGZ76_003299 [Entomortierella beljakovae]
MGCPKDSLIDFPLLGKFTLQQVYHMMQVVETLGYISGTSRLMAWLQEEFAPMNKPFSDWLSKHVWDQRDIKNSRFQNSFGFPVSFGCMLHFVGQEWIDDDTVTGILKFFQLNYGNRNVFILPAHFSTWCHAIESKGARSLIKWEEGKKEISNGNVDQVFTIVFMRNHWGDSMNLSTLMYAVDALLVWLKNVIPNFPKADHWRNTRSNIGVFNVPRQSDSWSCGIIAANAIETEVNPEAPRWSEESSFSANKPGSNTQTNQDGSLVAKSGLTEISAPEDDKSDISENDMPNILEDDEGLPDDWAPEKNNDFPDYEKTEALFKDWA